MAVQGIVITAPVCRLPGDCMLMPTSQVLPHYVLLPWLPVSSTLSTGGVQCSPADRTEHASSGAGQSTPGSPKLSMWGSCVVYELIIFSGFAREQSLAACHHLNREDIWSRCPGNSGGHPDTKRSWQVWSNVMRQEWETCQKKNSNVPMNWKQMYSLQSGATLGQEGLLTAKQALEVLF